MNPFVDATYADAIAHLAAHYGDRDALLVGARRYRFKELKQEADRASARFRSLGLRRGNSVALWLPNCPEFAFAWFGASQLGLVTVVINTRLRRDEFVYQIRQSRARVLVTAGRSAFRDFIGEFAEACLDESAPGPGPAVLSPQLPDLTHVIRVDSPDSSHDWILDWHAIDTPTQAPLELASDAGKPAMIAYSSGSTALPKGALLSHCIWRKAYDGGTYLGIGPDDTLYLGVPLFGVLGFLNGLLAFWSHGACVVLEERFDAGRCIDLVRHHPCTSILLLPPMVDALLDHPAFDRDAFASVRSGVMLSSNPEVMRHATQALGIPGLIAGYGLTESTGLVTRCRWDDPLEVRLSSQGRPLPGCQLRVVDLDTNEDQPPGRIGEILIGGYSVMLGYFEKEEETREVLTEDGWLKTGDLGCWTEDGSLRFLRRVSDGYKRNGFNVSTAEVEAAMLDFPGVAAAAVVPVDDGARGQVGVGFVTAAAGHDLDGQQVLAWVSDHLASFKHPAHIFVMDSLPMTSGTQKIQKYKLRELALEHMKQARPDCGTARKEQYT